MSVATTTPNLGEEGSSLVRGAFPQALISRWRDTAYLHYARIESLVQREGIEAVQRQLPPGQRYLPHVSSISLEGVYGATESQRIVECLAATSLREKIEHELGGAVLCDLDQAWVRRQYAIHRRPEGHVPHSWHQDGALLYPFDSTGAGAPAAGGLLRMVTCWVALTSCGQQAPGLELVRQRLDSLLPPATLTEDRVRARFPAERFWSPVMEPGDALLFSGGTLHRTHVEPHMNADRTSIELRFFRAEAIPERLAGDRFARFPSST